MVSKTKSSAIGLKQRALEYHTLTQFLARCNRQVKQQALRSEKFNKSPSMPCNPISKVVVSETKFGHKNDSNLRSRYVRLIDRTVLHTQRYAWIHMNSSRLVFVVRLSRAYSTRRQNLAEVTQFHVFALGWSVSILKHRQTNQKRPRCRAKGGRHPAAPHRPEHKRCRTL